MRQIDTCLSPVKQGGRRWDFCQLPPGEKRLETASLGGEKAEAQKGLVPAGPPQRLTLQPGF